MKLEKRKLEILSAIVDLYTKTLQPVGSRTVCDCLNFNVSPATVRNEMASLAELGLIAQPHVSAGRMPLSLGYRVYLDSLSHVCTISKREREELDGGLAEVSSDPERVVEGSAEILAKSTGCTTVFTAPTSAEFRVRAVKFIRIGQRSAMVILIVSTGMVKSRIFGCRFNITDEVLGIFEKVAQKFVGASLGELDSLALCALNVLEDGNFLVPAIDALIDVIKDAAAVEVIVKGERNLFSESNFEPDVALTIWEFLNNRAKVIEFLKSKISKCILVGDEVGAPKMEQASIIVSSYRAGQSSGKIALVGSIHMNYTQNLAKIEYISKFMEEILYKFFS
ncbi:MAG: heat-inducible transcriptional repressor HrcA [Oscillospiraceae bacterium]|nr:heat-inducible transcriptional repressor HrcA [Oscillospiraceae bacterium]